MTDLKTEINQKKSELAEETSAIKMDDYIIQSDTNEAYESFDNMGLKEMLVHGIYDIGFLNPTLLQQRAIVPCCTGKDVIVQAPYGSGKTGISFVSVLQRVDAKSRELQALIMVPTRELAQQIYLDFNALRDYMQLKFYQCVDGTELDQRKLQADVQVLVATPGSVSDLIQRDAINMGKIKMFILDEADELLSHGSKDQIYEVFENLPRNAQVILLSATMPAKLLEMAKKFMRDPTKFLTGKEEFLKGVRQFSIRIENEEWKFETLCDLYEMVNITEQVVIFCNTRQRVEDLARLLTNRQFSVAFIHEETRQTERDFRMREFRSGSSRIMITSDLLARNIEAQHLSAVINYDLPKKLEGYYRRIGCSARFDRNYLVINFVTPNDLEMLTKIETYYSTQIEDITDISPTNIHPAMFQI